MGKVGPAVADAAKARGLRPEDMRAPTTGEGVLARAFLLQKWMTPVLRRSYERTAAAMAACVQTGPARAKLVADRTCPECDQLSGAIADTRSHWKAQHWAPTANSVTALPHASYVSIEHCTQPRMPNGAQINDDYAGQQSAAA